MPIYEPWLRAKNGHQKDMGLKEIKVLAQNLLTVLGLTMDMIGGEAYVWSYNKNESSDFDNE